MALKIISCIFVISLAFGIAAPTQVKDVPFDVNDVVNRVSLHNSQPPNHQSLTPDLTGEFLIDTSIVYVGAPNDQISPAIAFDGTNYLVVWQDERSGSYDIYGARVNQSGVVLDSAGIPISTATYDQYYPSVAFDGTNYLVVWQSDEPDEYYDIYGARVNQSGVVLDSAGIPISTATYDQYYPSVAFDGTNYLVVWQSDEPDEFYDIDGSRVSPAGVVLDPEGIQISTATNDQRYPSIAFDGINYFVAWEDERSGSFIYDIYGARVNQSGVVLDPAGISISIATNDQHYPSVAFDGTNYLVVWQDERISSYDIYGARVNQSGNVLDPNGIHISTGINNERSPSVAFDGTNYLVVWTDFPSSFSDDIYGSRVSPTGVVLDTAGIPISTAVNDQQYPSVGFDGTNYLVIWADERNGSSDIYGTRASQSGTVLEPNGVLITALANEQRRPSVAFDGSNYFVVWEDWRSGYAKSDIYGARVSQSGSMLDPDSIPISIAANGQWNPSVAFDGTNYLVVWEDARNGCDIYGARVSQFGVVIDTGGFAISTATSVQKYASVSFDGTNYLVVWEDWRSGRPHPADIYGARVSQAGIVLDPNGIPISTIEVGYGQFKPSVTFGETNYIVVWSDFRSSTDGDIYGARLTMSGLILDSNGIAISTATNYQKYASVSFDGTNFLVVWEDMRNGEYPDIYGARVSQGGVVLDTTGIVISTAYLLQEYPSVAFDGTNYFVVWEDYRSGTSIDIYGVKVNQMGTVIDSFGVSLQHGAQSTPKLVKGVGNQMLIAYSCWTDSFNHRPVNTMRIWGKFYPFIGIEEENSKVKMQSAKLLEVYPNPAKSAMFVSCPLSLKELKVYDITGKLVKSFSINNQQLISNNYFLWNGTDDSGKKLPAGVYLLRLQTSAGTSETKEIIFMR
jgi:hypothetical protein